MNLLSNLPNMLGSIPQVNTTGMQGGATGGGIFNIGPNIQMNFMGGGF